MANRFYFCFLHCKLIFKKYYHHIQNVKSHIQKGNCTMTGILLTFSINFIIFRKSKTGYLVIQNVKSHIQKVNCTMTGILLTFSINSLIFKMLKTGLLYIHFTAITILQSKSNVSQVMNNIRVCDKQGRVLTNMIGCDYHAHAMLCLVLSCL